VSENPARHGRAPRGRSAGAARPGEELDVAAVDPWLKSRVPGLEGAPRVTQYSGGASNWTYRLEYDSHDLVLRRPPAGTKAKSAHDMGREFRIQKALGPVFPLVPEMIAFCDDAAVLGSDFYVMRRVDGIIPRAKLGVDLDRSRTRALCLAVIDTLVRLHKVDAESAGLSSLGRGAGYARRQVEGWTERYRRARTWNTPSFREVMAWLAANTPADVATCVIHNDFRLDNVVLDRADPTRVVGVLDWEMATLGDPLMDLGGSLAYWIEPGDDIVARATRRQPTHLPGMLTRSELVDYYCDRMGLRIAGRAFYEVFGLFRLAGIVQQIYYRYHHRETRNPAFRHFWFMAHYIDRRCRRLIRESRI
jgi:aminoglycoside phosphotransferase (APT) family kinase protein